MPYFSHLTTCTPTKSNLYLTNSLATAISDPVLYRLLTFQVPSNMSLFRLQLCDTSSRNTPHWRSEWGSSLPPDCFVSRESISPYAVFHPYDNNFSSYCTSLLLCNSLVLHLLSSICIVWIVLSALCIMVQLMEGFFYTHQNVSDHLPFYKLPPASFPM